MPKRIMLYALVNSAGDVQEETCLCSNHYNANNVEWHNLSYSASDGYAWLEFDPIAEYERNQEISAGGSQDTRKQRELSCNVCGYPIDRNVYTGMEDEE